MSDSKIKEYQRFVRSTDQFRDDSERSIAISFKNLRKEMDYLQQGHFDESLSKQIAKNRLGDALWYIVNLANHFKVDMSKIVEENIYKVKKLYPSNQDEVNQPNVELEELPHEFEMAFIRRSSKEVTLAIKLGNGEYFQIGDTINDNSHKEDFYRFHDVFHLALVAHLRWSPVMRALLKRKRKSEKDVDTVEDGARAAILEEAISAAVFG